MAPPGAAVDTAPRRAPRACCNREDLTEPVRRLRASAQRLGLLRVQRGELLVTTAGAALRDDPTGPWRHVVERPPGRPEDAFPRTATTLLLLATAAGRADERQLATVLTAAGWSGRAGTGVHRYAVSHAAEHVDEVLDLVDAYEGRPSVSPAGVWREQRCAAGEREPHALPCRCGGGGTVADMRPLTEIGGRRLPFLRWSVIRLLVGRRRLTTQWQVGDGREDALADHVTRHARAGDVDDAIRVVDEFCYTRSFMINIGDEKGALLDAAVRRTSPRLVLELGTYCGYSALRISRALPADARIVSVELSEANARVARRVLEHAGVVDRVTVVVGAIGDGGGTMDALEQQHDVTTSSVDLVFLDHDKDAYLPDLERLLTRGWLHPGTVVVADNVRFPGAPEYRAFMTRKEGRSWRTVEHETHVEYQSLVKDLVLESEYLRAPG